MRSPRLASKYRDDRRTYTDAKAEFINMIIDTAIVTTRGRESGKEQLVIRHMASIGEIFHQSVGSREGGVRHGCRGRRSTGTCSALEVEWRIESPGHRTHRGYASTIHKVSRGQIARTWSLRHLEPGEAAAEARYAGRQGGRRSPGFPSTRRDSPWSSRSTRYRRPQVPWRARGGKYCRHPGRRTGDRPQAASYHRAGRSAA